MIIRVSSHQIWTNVFKRLIRKFGYCIECIYIKGVIYIQITGLIVDYLGLNKEILSIKYAFQPMFSI